MEKRKANRRKPTHAKPKKAEPKARAAASERTASGRFAPGHRKLGGRTEGSGFRILATREALEHAIDAYPGGAPAYVAFLMVEHPRAFVALWRDHVPKVVEIDPGEHGFSIRWAGEDPAGRASA